MRKTKPAQKIGSQQSQIENVRTLTPKPRPFPTLNSELQLPLSASAPGNLMLLGEHAVLHGRRALVCAIDQRITVSLSNCLEPVVRIFSTLGTYETSLDTLEDHHDFRFILDAVRQYPLRQGIELKIKSDFPNNLGFGSSAAITVATHAVLMKMEGIFYKKVHKPLGKHSLPFMELLRRSLATIHRVQGQGSGADVAASVFGGVVVYRAEPLEITPIKQLFPLTAVYSGSKKKTLEVIQLVEKRRAANPSTFDQIFDEMDSSVGKIITHFSTLGTMLSKNQKLMEKMGLCNKALSEIIQHFKTLNTPAKISGSGLGDCVIGLGAFPNSENASVYSLMVSADGVY